MGFQDKARLVAKDFTQIEGIDYEQMLSTMARFVSIRLFLTLLAHLKLELF